MILKAVRSYPRMLTMGKVYKTLLDKNGQRGIIADSGRFVELMAGREAVFDIVTDPPPARPTAITMPVPPDKPEWMKWRDLNADPNNCACGCPRKDCPTHKY